ncbi:MAG: GHKL domain-containing protein [Bacilli bacterium]|jgi:sensor histidine kinase regulating citrate/malate metabolism
MLDKNDIEGAKKYLSQYDSLLEESKSQNYCENSIVNALLRIYSRKFQKKGIYFSVNASISKDIKIFSPTLGSILSNLLENAYEACKTITGIKPQVVFKVVESDDNLEIEVRNSSTSKRALSIEGIPYTTKHGGGTGLRSVKNEITKCGGDMRIKQTDNEFIVQIVISLTKN